MTTLVRPQETFDVLKKYQFSIQKKYGQNFLIDPHVLEKIMEAAQITKDDFVIEIGPGIGTMTQGLCERAREVAAIEIDAALIPVLQDTLSSYHNVTVIHRDVLKTNGGPADRIERNGDRRARRTAAESEIVIPGIGLRRIPESIAADVL